MASVDHIGIAVDDLDAARRLFEDLLGLEIAYEWFNPTLDVRSVFYRLGDALLEVAQHLDSRTTADRSGRPQAVLEHVALRVDNIDGLVARWRARAIAFERETPRTTERPTGLQRDIFFSAPGATGGVRYQLVERIA